MTASITSKGYRIGLGKICPDNSDVSACSDQKELAPQATQASKGCHDHRGWEDLPEPLLELVFRRVKGRRQDTRALYTVCSVCSTWRAAGQRLFFSDPWLSALSASSAGTICHPAQLFVRAPPGRTTGAHVKCYVVREVISVGVSGYLHKFTLMQGAEYASGVGRFLLLAAQHSKRCFSLHLSRCAAERPVAWLAANMLRTAYSLAPDAGCRQTQRWLAADSAGGGPSGSTHPLVRVQYKLRVRGVVLPRRMDVELPCPSHLQQQQPQVQLQLHSRLPACDTQQLQPSASGPQASAGTAPRAAVLAAYGGGSTAAGGSGLCSSSTGSLDQGGSSTTGQAGTCPEHRGGSCVLSCSSIHSNSSLYASSSSGGGVGERAGEKRGTSATKGAAEAAAQACADAAGKGNASASAPPRLLLRNKPPHWSESLRCWCLNFRGRVKLASVKNFQMVAELAPDGGGECRRSAGHAIAPSAPLGSHPGGIAVQFGKVDTNLYILDFDPVLVSAVQAFGICLTTFESKALL